MTENYDIPKKINPSNANKVSYRKFYGELDAAIKRRDKSNIYRLSKAITRYHLSQ
jgi:hypothetical protein